MKRLLQLTLLVCFILGFGALQAADKEGLLNKLFAPGPLIEGHKDLEGSDCLKCHDAGKGVPDSKCLDCHDEIKAFTDKKTGYHGLQTKSCRECHVDHKGREFDSTAVNQKVFDHDLTGYKLEGKHSELKCRECHKEHRQDKFVNKRGIRYMGNQTTCVSCHKDDDIHFFKNKWKKKDCNECHGLKKWTTDIDFDHFKAGKFKLQGRHAKLKCAKCHVISKRKKTSRYKWKGLKSKQCLSCHKDVHRKNLSRKFQNGKCTTCHTQTKWKIKNFDHKKATKWPLRGKHKKAKCTECHKQSKRVRRKKTKYFKWTGLKNQCLSCHKDYHYFGKHKFKGVRGRKKYQNLNSCIECHSEDGWKKPHSFSHNKQTRWVVDGKHRENKCEDCHIKTKKKWRKTKKTSVYFWKQLESKTCENCHKNPHTKEFDKKFLKKKCTECHTTLGWDRQPQSFKSDFNHDKTRFKLTGRHRKLKCNACHLVNKKRVFSFDFADKQFCADCHKNQHKDQFSKEFYNKSCAECHTNRNFTKLKKFNHDKTSFKIRGKHKKLNCFECHSKTKKFFDKEPKKRAKVKHKFLFPDLKDKSCVTCHTDYHKKQLGNDCTTCHTEKSWKKSIFDHNKHSDFRLRGKHKKAKCKECHKPRKREYVKYKKKRRRVINYKPIEKSCYSCHKEDDEHKGRFGTKCQECHTEKGWNVVKDFHKNFTLHGVHYTLQCAECHQDNRRLSGMSESCIMCHQSTDVHNGTLPDCGDCHGQQFWGNNNFRHSLSSFPLRGTHRTLSCGECHSSGIYQGLPDNCLDCHMSDSQAVGSPVHTLPNFQECNDCHNQFTFDLGL